MFDFNVQILQNNQLTTVNLSTYLKGKTVIVCPAVKFIQRSTLEYFKYIDSLLDTHKLDEILLVNNKEDKFFHMLVKSYFPRFTTVTDVDQNYIKKLRKIKKIDEDVEELAKNWSFQQVFQNGEELGFWEQPLSDQWEHLLRNKKAVKLIINLGSWQHKIFKKMYNERYKVNLWDLKHTNFLYLQPVSAELLHTIGPRFFYFNLFHNQQLEKVLFLNKAH